MRFVKAGIGLAVLLALVFAPGAEAGGKGAVKAIMYEGQVYVMNASGMTRTYAVGDEAGFAIMNATPDNMMKFLVKVQDGLADAEFDVTVVPGMWGTDSFTLTTDKKGKGMVAFELPIPSQYVTNGVAPVKVVVTNVDDPDILYVTDTREPPFTNPPGNLSTTVQVNLK